MTTAILTAVFVIIVLFAYLLGAFLGTRAAGKRFVDALFNTIDRSHISEEEKKFFLDALKEEIKAQTSRNYNHDKK